MANLAIAKGHYGKSHYVKRTLWQILAMAKCKLWQIDSMSKGRYGKFLQWQKGLYGKFLELNRSEITVFLN